MRSLTRLAAFVLVVSFVASAPPPLGAAVTDTFRDEFNSISYAGSDGTGSWAGPWTESEADQNPGGGSTKVSSDGAEDFALQFTDSAGGESIHRTADLSGYDSASLVFEYRRVNTDLAFSFKAWISANGPAGPFTEVFSIASGDDAVYVATNVIDISAHRSATTTLRFTHEGGSLGGGRDFFLDNIEISAFAANLPPVATDDSGSTGIDIPVTIDVLANDSDPDTHPLAVDSVTQGVNGSVVNNGTDVTYTPDSGWSGVDTFTYTVTDGNGGFDTATVTVDVNGICYLVGDGGGSDSLSWVDMDTSVETVVGATGTTGITAAAFDPVSGTLYAALPDRLGTINTATGTFTPKSTSFGGGFDNVQAIAVDTDGTVYAFHHLSGAKDRLFEIEPATGALVPDAFGPGVDSVALNSLWPGQDSVVGISINDGGDMYGVTRDDSFSYKIQRIYKTSGFAFVVGSESETVDISIDPAQRGWGLSAGGVLDEGFGSGLHTLTLLSGYQALACGGDDTNQAPSAFGDSDSTAEDTAVTVDVLANDSDPDLDPLTVDSVTQGANGSVVNNGTDVTYTPNPNWNGTDTFTYTVTDGNGGFASAQVTVTVLAQPDPPVAVDDSDSTAEDTAVTVDVLANDSDGDLDPLTVDSVTQGANGSVTNNGTDVTYDPDPDWFGIDTFTYTVTDGNGGFDTASVTVDVASVNDPPSAVDDSDSTSEDTAVTVDVLANDSDPDLDPLTVDSVTQGANGSVVNDGTDVTYTPNPNWNGTDTFTYTVTDGNGGFATASVMVDVNPVNDDPMALDDTEAMNEDSSSTISVLANDDDRDGDPLTITGVIDGAHGTVVNNGTDVTYFPDPDWSGTDTFMYTVSDGNGGTASAMVTVTVNPVNDDPLGQSDAATTPEDTAVTVDVLANDTDVDSVLLAVTAVTGGGNGLVTTDGLTVTYSPDPDWNGTDTFSYRVSDDSGGWCDTDVTVTVIPVNDDPVAVDDTGTTERDSSAYIWVLANDTDADLDGLTVSAVTNGAHGTVTNNGFKVTYQPESGWTGTDTFTYTVIDGNGGFDWATVTVEVTTGPNRPPIARDDTKTTDEDTSVTVPVLANDSDPDGDPVTVASVNQGAHGIVSKTSTTVTYTPDRDWSGIDSFSYTITDSRGGSATAAVIVTVRAVNDAPVARDDAVSTPTSTTVDIQVLANDSDVDGDALALVEVTQGAHGVTVSDGSTVTYSPSSGWTGTDSFTYTVTDGHGGRDTATVMVSVAVPNRPPTITITGQDEVDEGQELVIEIIAADPDGDPVTVSAPDLPEWAGLVDEGKGSAAIVGTPDFDQAGTIEIIISASDGRATVSEWLVIEVVNVNRAPVIEPIGFSGVNDDGSFTFTIRSFDPDGDPVTVTAEGLPSWTSLTDDGTGRAVITSAGVPDEAVGSFAVVVQVTDGEVTVTSNLARPIADLRNVRPPELTHRVFETGIGDSLVATNLKPQVASPDPPKASLSPREGLMVAFGSAVETLRNQILPSLILGVVMAWMLMIGVGRVKDEEESA